MLLPVATVNLLVDGGGGDLPLASDLLLFYLFAAITVGGALLVVGQRNPIYSVVAIVGSFCGLSGLYVLLEAPFVAVVQIIIYAGAILVLFLFTVMLLNASARGRRRVGPHASLLSPGPDPHRRRARGGAARCSWCGRSRGSAT